MKTTLTTRCFVVIPSGRSRTFRILKHWMKDGQVPSRKKMQDARASRDLWSYLQHIKSIRLENGVLVIDRLSAKPPAPTWDTRPILPHAARLRVTAAHHELCCGHLAVDYTTRLVQTWAWWPTIVNQVSNYVATCQRCRQKRFQSKPSKPSNQFLKTSGYVGQTVCVDLLGPFPAGPNNKTYCLTSIDLFSKYLTAVPITGKSAPVVMTAFMDPAIGKGGNVENVHSDNRKEWINKLLRMTTLLHIKHSKSLPYHPLGNAAIESSHSRIKSILHASLGRQPTVLWTKGVKGAVRTLNSLQHPATGLSPNFLYYGRETSLPLASLVTPPRPEFDPLTPQERVIQLAQQSVKYLIQQRCGLEVIQRRRVHLGNMKHPLYPLPAHVGQSVLVCDTSELRNHPSRSLAPR